jgi:hypothetical protein
MFLRLISAVLFFCFSTALYSQNQTTRSFGQPRFTPQQIVESLHKAYPEAIDRVGTRNGDQAFRIRGQWFSWAEGRLLPSHLADKFQDFSSWPFYPYSTLYNPPLPEFSPEEKKSLNERLDNRESSPISRSGDFYSLLYRITDRESAWNMMKTTYFLGFKVLIHRDLLEDLARVEEHIQDSMVDDQALRDYVESIELLSGFNWRVIAGTETLSNHSYGIAIDVIPKNYNGKHAYWRWFKAEYPEWYSLPWELRYIPPESFVQAFEQEGFIWGGKWFFFDGIHFEYRPEILLLNGIHK